MMRTSFLFFIFILLFQTANFGQSQEEFIPKFRKSKKTTHKIKKGQNQTFGYLVVLENRQDRQSGTIELPIYIFESRSDNPTKDSIIYTVGGPGSTSMPTAHYMNYYQYLDDRDFILVEQRENYYENHIQIFQNGPMQFMNPISHISTATITINFSRKLHKHAEIDSKEKEQILFSGQ